MAHSGFLTRVNPTAKLLFHLAAMLLLVVVSDPLTSFLCMLIPAGLAFLFVRVPLKKLLWLTSPFFLLFLLSVWGLFAFGDGETVWWTWGWFHFTKEGLYNGLTIGFRTLGYLFYGVIFVLTTDVTDFVFSLMQQLRLKPKLAYALLAGVRFLPQFWSEFEQIRAARRVRGVRRSRGVAGKIGALMRYTIPLLAQAIRKADRVAVALEARGFDGTWNRTFQRRMSLGIVDIVYGTLLIGLYLIAIGISSYYWNVNWGFLV